MTLSPPIISLAPMMQRTDRHFRYMLRLITKRTLLYTEMVTAGAILHGDADFHLAYSHSEHPLALQLGGDDPEKLARCARQALRYGYDEVNLNVGCPSDRVQRGAFGAVLMRTPEIVRDCVTRMHEASGLPVTVKHRIGVDELDHYDHMKRFVDVVSESPCVRFSVHARKAWLKGLSPKQNREVPPLRYPEIYRLKRERPDLCIEINGGITELEQIKSHLQYVDGVMIGRAAYDTPMLFARVDQEIFGENRASVTDLDVALKMLEYAEDWVAKGGRLHHISRHMMALFQGRPGARSWRRALSNAAIDPTGSTRPLRNAIDLINQHLPLDDS